MAGSSENKPAEVLAYRWFPDTWCLPELSGSKCGKARVLRSRNGYSLKLYNNKTDDGTLIFVPGPQDTQGRFFPKKNLFHPEAYLFGIAMRLCTDGKTEMYDSGS